MEASFFVNEDTLRRIQPGIQSDEAGLLSAFDSHRDMIHAAAVKVYRRGRKGRAIAFQKSVSSRVR
jgi:Protein of unknown function (DUF1488)